MLSSAAGSPLAKLRRGGAGRKQDSTKSPRTRARLDKKNKRQQVDRAAKRQSARRWWRWRYVTFCVQHLMKLLQGLLEMYRCLVLVCPRGN